MLNSGWAAHIKDILQAVYPNKLDISTTRLIENGENFKYEIALHFGNPSMYYQGYLANRLAAQYFKRPKVISKLLEIFLVTNQLYSARDLTLSNLNKTSVFSLWSARLDDWETLCVFLDDKEDLGVATAYWNTHWGFRRNKIFLPRTEFIENIEACVEKILQFMPYIRALRIVTPSNKEDATNLCELLKEKFIQYGQEILVITEYREYSYDWQPGRLYSSTAEEVTRSLSERNEVRFALPIPKGHEKTKFLFGYDAEVKSASG